MKLIAHRGNFKGKHKADENKPEYITTAIHNHYDVEIDIWKTNGELWLGHDAPFYKININFIDEYKDKLWIHLKNLEAVTVFNKTDYNWFWHENDKFTLTSKGFVWAFPEIFIENSIVNQPSSKSKFWSLRKITNFYGCCADNFINF